MERFAYEILVGREQPGVPGNVFWHLSSNMNQPLGPNLPVILNQLGQAGWEVVGVGDVGFDSRADIILKRRIA